MVKPRAEASQLVYDIRNPTVFGRVVVAGTEVSQVLWGDGTREYVTNEHLKSKLPA